VPVVAGPCPEGLRAVARRRICSSDGGARGPGKGELRRMRGPPAGERWRWRGPTPTGELRRRRADLAAMAQIRPPPPGSGLLYNIECGGGVAPARASSGACAALLRASAGGGAAPRRRASSGDGGRIRRPWPRSGPLLLDPAFSAASSVAAARPRRGRAQVAARHHAGERAQEVARPREGERWRRRGPTLAGEHRRRRAHARLPCSTARHGTVHRP